MPQQVQLLLQSMQAATDPKDVSIKKKPAHASARSQPLHVEPGPVCQDDQVSSSGGGEAPPLQTAIDEVFERFKNIQRRSDAYPLFFPSESLAFSAISARAGTAAEFAAAAENKSGGWLGFRV